MKAKTTCIPLNYDQNEGMKEAHFHSSHPGFGGAIAALPANIKTLADAWIGKIAPVNDFVREVEKLLPDARLNVDWKHRCILLLVKDSERIHCWKVIEFDLIEK